MRTAIATVIAFRPGLLDPIAQQLLARGADSVYTGSIERVANYVKGAQKLSASLDALGSKTDRVAITAHLPEEHLASLRGSNWCVRDFSERYNGSQLLGFDMLRIYRPLYSESQARQQRRPWTQATQTRSDGAATYFKLLAWTFTSYHRVLVMDSDAYFLASPDAYLVQNPPYFAANAAAAGRHFIGFNSHLMIITPDLNVFDVLVDKAASGMYLTFTNTDQDVLETIFTASRSNHLPHDMHHAGMRTRSEDAPSAYLTKVDEAGGHRQECRVSEHVITPLRAVELSTLTVVETWHKTGSLLMQDLVSKVVQQACQVGVSNFCPQVALAPSGGGHDEAPVGTGWALMELGAHLDTPPLARYVALIREPFALIRFFYLYHLAGNECEYRAFSGLCAILRSPSTTKQQGIAAVAELVLRNMLPNMLRKVNTAHQRVGGAAALVLRLEDFSNTGFTPTARRFFAFLGYSITDGERLLYTFMDRERLLRMATEMHVELDVRVSQWNTTKLVSSKHAILGKGVGQEMLELRDVVAALRGIGRCAEVRDYGAKLGYNTSVNCLALPR